MEGFTVPLRALPSPHPSTRSGSITMPDHPPRLRSTCCRALGLGLTLVGLLAIAAWARASELRETPIVKAVQQVRPSVVNIRGEKVVAATAAGVAKGEMTPPRQRHGHGHRHRLRGATSSPITTWSTASTRSRSPRPTRALHRQDPLPRPGNRPGDHQDPARSADDGRLPSAPRPT